jgi:hypothetical protein
VLAEKKIDVISARLELTRQKPLGALCRGVGFQHFSSTNHHKVLKLKLFIAQISVVILTDWILHSVNDGEIDT